jgi:GT2 family glycosyltransferase
MGVQAAKGELIGVLNDDIIFSRGWLRPLVEFLMENTGAGLASPKLLYDEDTYDSLGVETNLMMVAWDKFSRIAVGHYDPKEPFKVAAPPGAALLFPRRILASLNGELLDVGYGSYYEEVDLGLRLGLMGYDSFMVPASSVIHKRGSTYGLMTPVKLYLIRRNAVRTGAKLLGIRSIPFLPIWFAASLYASYIYYASTGDSGYILVPFRAARSTLTSFRAIWSKHLSFELLRRKPLLELPFSNSLVINADRIGRVGRIGVTFFNMIASLVGLGKFKITTSKKYRLWGLPK